MQLKHTNFTGLLALVGTVAGFALAGIFYSEGSWLAVPFLIAGSVSFLLVIRYIYNFLKYSPYGNIPDEEARSIYWGEEAPPADQEKK